MNKHKLGPARAQAAIVALAGLLIVLGAVLFAWGVGIWILNRPSPAEQSLLARGREVSAEMSPPESGSPAILPDNSSQSETDARATAESAAPPVPLPTKQPTPTTGRIPAHSPPTRIVAPTINLDAKVVEVGWKTVTQGKQQFSVWETADYAAGFHKGSAFPGNPGNTVLSGHHNIKGEVFRYVVDLNKGDPVILYAERRQYVYQVVDKFIVQEEGVPLEQRYKNAQWIAHTDDERLTLVTCWPYWANTHRVIVIAKPVPEPNGDTPTTAVNTMPGARP